MYVHAFLQNMPLFFVPFPFSRGDSTSEALRSKYKCRLLLASEKREIISAWSRGTLRTIRHIV